MVTRSQECWDLVTIRHFAALNLGLLLFVPLAPLNLALLLFVPLVPLNLGILYLFLPPPPKSRSIAISRS